MKKRFFSFALALAFLIAMIPAALATTGDIVLAPGESYELTNTTTSKVTLATNAAHNSTTAYYDRVTYAVNGTVSLRRDDAGSLDIGDRGRAVITNSSKTYNLTVTLPATGAVTAVKSANPALAYQVVATRESYEIKSARTSNTNVSTTAAHNNTTAYYDRVSYAVNGGVSFRRRDAGDFTISERGSARITNASDVYDFTFYCPYEFAKDLTITKTDLPALYEGALREKQSVSLFNEVGGNVTVGTSAAHNNTTPYYDYTRVNVNGATDTRTRQAGDFTMADRSKWTITNTSDIYVLEMFLPYERAAKVGFPAPAGGWIAGGVVTAPGPAPNVDSASNWAQEGVNEAYGKGIIPDEILGDWGAPITRGEFCKMAVKWVEYALNDSIDNILAQKGIALTPKFSDTNDPYILAAFELGITGGTVSPTETSLGQFDPNGTLVRQQAAVLIFNTYTKVVGVTVSGIPNAGFDDMSAVASWAVNGVNFVRFFGFMNGTSPTTFTPLGVFTRDQAIVTFNNFSNNVSFDN